MVACLAVLRVVLNRTEEQNLRYRLVFTRAPSDGDDALQAVSRLQSSSSPKSRWETLAAPGCWRHKTARYKRKKENTGIH